MKSSLKKITTNPLFSGSLVMIIGSNLTNAINYFYHLIMGRILGPSNYGELAALISLVGIISIFPSALGLVIVRFTSIAKSEPELASIIKGLNKLAIYFSICVFLLLVILALPLSKFLRINEPILIIILSGYFLFSIASYFNKSFLQGHLKFRQMVSVLFTENILKLTIALGLIYVGFSVGGAVVGIVASAAAGWGLSRLFLKKYSISQKPKPIDFRPWLSFAVPVILQSLALTSLYSSDVLLVKHFFNNQEAGFYAALSNLSKIIFFGTSPIAAVMFPIVSKRKAQGQNYGRIFSYSLILTAFVALLILGIYYLFPVLAIKALYGSAYIQVYGLLVWFGLFITLLAIATLVVNYYLSLGVTKIIVIPVLAAVIQLIGISLFHSNLFNVLEVSLAVTSLMIIGLGLFSVSNRLLGLKS